MRLIQLRIGIHLGDVEQRESDIFGDAVNIASRIEPHAPPGGVCISGEVASQIRNKISNQLEKLPPTALKGVSAPIDLYRVVLPWTGRGTVSPGNGPRRLAVLPFTNMSPDPADMYFADGLTEELITVLSQLRELRVIARTSVMQYKSTTMEVSLIGTNLGVSSILEGSVRRAGNRLRITAQLIDVNSQEHVWAKSYDRELNDVFLIQSEVAREVAEALKIELRPQEETRLEERPPVRPDSYLAYLKGRSLLQSEWSEEVFRTAKEQFELALSLDPTNARAHSGWADAVLHLQWGRYERPGAEQDAAIRSHVARGLALDPYLAEAHATLGTILWNDSKNSEAERELRLALSLNPSYAPAHYSLAHLLVTLVKTEEALREFQIAVELDPSSLQYLSWYCLFLSMLRRLDEVQAPLQKMKTLFGDNPQYFRVFGYSQYARGDYTGLLATAGRLDELEASGGSEHRIWAFTATGRMEEARALIKKEESRPSKPGLSQRATWLALVGDLDGCFHCLDEALERRELPIQVWRFEPALEAVRSDPRFQTVLKKLNLA